MSYKDKNLKFLLNNGYKPTEFGYEIRYHVDDYGAINRISIDEVINMPDDVLIEYHDRFMEMARNKEIF